MTKKSLIVGHGRAGKDTALSYLAQITSLRNAGTTSRYLAPYIAEQYGLTVEDVYRRRHESDEIRQRWYKVGNKVRENDPAILIKEALKNGDMTGGVRDKIEVLAARNEGLVDLIIWIENKNVPVDPTLKFGPEDCDIIIQNSGSLDSFYDKLYRFAKFSSLPEK